MDKIADAWKKQSTLIKYLLTGICILFALLPWLAFVIKFGINWSNDISAWVNTATYFNNIYTPILTLIGAYLVYRSYTNQRKSNRISEQAYVYNYIKEQLVRLIESTTTDSNKVLKNSINSNPNAMISQFYNKWFEELHSSATVLCGHIIFKIRKIEISMTNYRFLENPKEMFREEFKTLVVFLKICEKALLLIKNQKETIKISRPDYYKIVIDQIDFKQIDDLIESIQRITKEYEI